MARMLRLDAEAVRAMAAMAPGAPSVPEDAPPAVAPPAAEPQPEVPAAPGPPAAVVPAAGDGGAVPPPAPVGEDQPLPIEGDQPPPEPEPNDPLAAALEENEKLARTIEQLQAQNDAKAMARRNDLTRQLVRPRQVAFGLLLLGTLASGLVFLTRADGFHPTKAYAWAGVVGASLLVLAVFAILEAYRWNEGGFFSFVIGGDGRLSTSLTQSALWTFLLAGAFIYFLTRISFGPDPASESLESLDESYLLLLGGPFAAAVLAGLFTRSKLDQQTIQKVDADQAALKDLLTKDDGSGDLVDAQFLVFNLVAMVWFVGTLAAEPTDLPSIPPALVGLTSLAALTYTASKAAAQNAPGIQSVSRHTDTDTPAGPGIRPGDLVDVRGRNLVPAGGEQGENILTTRVGFGGSDVLPVPAPEATASATGTNGTVTGRYPSSEWLVAQVPAGVTGSTVSVTVLTAAGNRSDPIVVRLDTDVPVISSVEPSQSHRHGWITIRGYYFARPGATADLTTVPAVKIGGVSAPKVEWILNGTAVKAQVPNAVAVGQLDVVLRALGGTVDSNIDHVSILG